MLKFNSVRVFDYSGIPLFTYPDPQGDSEKLVTGFVELNELQQAPDLLARGSDRTALSRAVPLAAFSSFTKSVFHRHLTLTLTVMEDLLIYFFECRYQSNGTMQLRHIVVSAEFTFDGGFPTPDQVADILALCKDIAAKFLKECLAILQDSDHVTERFVKAFRPSCKGILSEHGLT